MSRECLLHLYHRRQNRPFAIHTTFRRFSVRTMPCCRYSSALKPDVSQGLWVLLPATQFAARIRSLKLFPALGPPPNETGDARAYEAIATDAIVRFDLLIVGSARSPGTSAQRPSAKSKESRTPPSMLEFLQAFALICTSRSLR